jgi:uncharacterized membrane protein YhaH (DUF805 family)
MNVFKEYFLGTLKERYAQFEGRASRSEFWYFALFNFLVGIGISILDTLLGTSYTYVYTSNIAAPNMSVATVEMKQSIGYLSFLYGIFVLIPSLALAVRRLHDTDKSGWWLLLLFIPILNILGFFILLFFYVQPSWQGENRYGSAPLA